MSVTALRDPPTTQMVSKDKHDPVTLGFHADCTGLQWMMSSRVKTTVKTSTTMP